MAEKRAEIETFIRGVAAAMRAAQRAGAEEPAAIADALNAQGVTTRKGRRWTGATVAKFLSSPGAKRLGAPQLGGASDGRC